MNMYLLWEICDPVQIYCPNAHALPSLTFPKGSVLSDQVSGASVMQKVRRMER